MDKPKHDFKDPFAAGQMIGMLTMLTFIEKNKGIPIAMLTKLKGMAANNAQVYFEIPTEDIYLMIDKMVNNIEDY